MGTIYDDIEGMESVVIERRQLSKKERDEIKLKKPSYLDIGTEKFAKYAGKKVLLVLSGGLDSTTLLFLLTAAGADVRVIYIEGCQGILKYQTEKAAIDRILDYHHEVFETPRLKLHTNSTRFKYNIANDQHSNNQQVLDWLIGIRNWIHADEFFNYVIMGYIRGDKIVPQLGEISSIWESMWNIVYDRDNEARNHMPKLAFPLVDEHYTKLDLMRMIDQRLAAMLWVCELPFKHTACGVCNSCDRMMRDSIDPTGVGTMNYIAYAKAVGLKDPFLGFFDSMRGLKDDPAPLEEQYTLIDPENPSL